MLLLLLAAAPMHKARPHARPCVSSMAQPRSAIKAGRASCCDRTAVSAASASAGRLLLPSAAAQPLPGRGLQVLRLGLPPQLLPPQGGALSVPAGTQHGRKARPSHLESACRHEHDWPREYRTCRPGRRWLQVRRRRLNQSHTGRTLAKVRGLQMLLQRDIAAWSAFGTDVRKFYCQYSDNHQESTLHQPAFIVIHACKRYSLQGEHCATTIKLLFQCALHA